MAKVNGKENKKVVPNAPVNKPKVPRNESQNPKVEDAKTEHTNNGMEDTKVEDTKVTEAEDTKVEDTKVTEAEEAKAEEAKVEEAKAEEADSNNTLPVVTPETPEVPMIGDEVVRGRMKKANIEESIYNIIKKRKKLRFDLSIQRNDVWSETQKCMLIHSILDGYPIPQVFIESSDDDFLWTLDGRQRLSTILSFYDDGFHLLKDTPAVIIEDEDGKPSLVEIEGKKFSTLDIDLQQQFLNYTMSIVEMKNITTAQREELFQRLNAGSALTKMELTRAQAGEYIMDFIEDIAKTRFFGQLTSLSDKQRNRFVDQELILQTLALAMGRETGISTKEINEFVKVLKVDEIDKDFSKNFDETTQYIAEALNQFVKINDKGEEDFKPVHKMTKKIHTPMLFLTAMIAKEEGRSPVAFGHWVRDFFDNRYKAGVGAYGSHTQAGSAKSSAVKARIRAMKEDYHNNIERIEQMFVI